MSNATQFLTLVVTAMVPFILASQGTMLGGRAGVFNVSQEGVMALGASVAFLVSLKSGSTLVGLVVALLAGAVFGLVLGAATTNLRLDQFVVGLALFFAATGLATLLYKVVIGVATQPPLVPTLPQWRIPGLASIPVVGPAVFDQNGLVYFALLLSAALYWLLYHTSLGMRLRAVGENPKCADSLGVSITSTRIVTSVIGSGLIALGGAYIPLVYTGTYTDGMVAGRGWLAIALTFFGAWRPQFILPGAAFFAAMEVLALRVQVQGIDIPHQFIGMLPYVATLLIIIVAARWARAPAFLGRNYDRESRTAL